jgi:SAM-dependent methyltransferase
MNASGQSPADRRGGALPALQLVLLSFVALFLELALIRWVPGCIKVIGYYTNLVLISSVLGLGLGCAAGERGASGWKFPLWLLISLAAYASIQWIGLFPLPSAWGEHVWWGLGRFGMMPALLMPEAVFALNTATFIPLGRQLAGALNRFPPLSGYSLNLAGSLAGSLALAAVSALMLGPVSWFVLAGLAYLGALAAGRAAGRRIGLAAGMLLVSLVAVYLPARGNIWSPYYKITVGSIGRLFNTATFDDKNLVEALGVTSLSVNDDYFQFAVNLDPVVLQAATARSPVAGRTLMGLSDFVQLPYRIHPPARVLILGTGMGNDVAAALRNGAQEVDAVEIDPMILSLGRARHPERPYSDPRVHVYNTDARRFLKQPHEPYDLIVYGFLDSHALFSAYSSLRLDTFVYTQQSFQQASRLLKPDGAMVVLFAASHNFVGKRLFTMVRNVYPESASAWSWQDPSWGLELDVIAGGPGVDQVSGPAVAKLKNITAEYAAGTTLVPTDDWPFLYLKGRFVGWIYGLTLVALLAIAAGFTRKVVPQFRGLSAPFFLLGAAFMLLETKSVTELSLLFGSTWVVNVAVITAFLGMALAANLYIARAPAPSPRWLYVLLLAAIGGALLVPTGSLLFSRQMLSAAAGGAMVALPVFFSGMIFALWFKAEPDPARALGSNILGLVAGGMLEYLSLTTGFKALYLVAAGLYLGAWFARKR